MSGQQVRVQAPMGDRGRDNPMMITTSTGGTRGASPPQPYPTQQQPYPTQQQPYPTQQHPGTFAVYQPGQQYPAGSAVAMEAGVTPGPAMEEERSGKWTGKRKVGVGIAMLIIVIAAIGASIPKLINSTNALSG